MDTALTDLEIALLRCLAKTNARRSQEARAAIGQMADAVPGHVMPRDCPHDRLVALGYVRELPETNACGQRVPGAIVATHEGRRFRLEITASGRRVVDRSIMEN